MDWVFLILMGLALFVARDVYLLASGASDARFAHRWIAYGVVHLGLFTGLGVAAEFVSRSEALRLLRDAAFWIPAIALHLLLWLMSMRMKRRARRRKYAWTLALAPAPVLVYCMGGLCWLALRWLNSVEGWSTGFLLGAFSLALVMLATWLMRRTWGNMATSKALDFAGAVNLSAILLVPLHQKSESSTLLMQPADWKTTLIALCITCGLIGASFLFHRFRRSV